MSWAELYQRLRDDPNDPEAWKALEDGVRLRAQSQLWRRGSHIVEDAVADTCSRVVMNIDRARGPETFSGFVLGHYLNVRRRLIQAMREDLPLDGLELTEPTDAEEQLDQQELGVLRLCLTELPERERRAVELKYWQDADSDEIAKALDVTTTNARQLVFRALAKLRQCTERELSGLRNATSAPLPIVAEGH